MCCSPAVMYSVCKPDIPETSKSEPLYALFAIVSSEHTQQRIWQKLAHCRVLFIAVRMFTRQKLDVQPSVLNCECSSQTASTSDNFSPFLFALYLLWDNFLLSEVTSIYVNATKITTCQPQSVHSLLVLITESATLPQLAWFQASSAV